MGGLFRGAGGMGGYGSVMHAAFITVSGLIPSAVYTAF